ncbi:hypothetical protein CKW48_18455, partial [Bordetella pertussis]
AVNQVSEVEAGQQVRASWSETEVKTAIDLRGEGLETTLIAALRGDCRPPDAWPRPRPGPQAVKYGMFLPCE